LDAIFERATMGKQGGTSKNHFFSSVIPNNAKLREPKKGIFEFGGCDDILAKFTGCS
jgi:hypothetical protein